MLEKMSEVRTDYFDNSDNSDNDSSSDTAFFKKKLHDKKNAKSYGAASTVNNVVESDAEKHLRFVTGKLTSLKEANNINSTLSAYPAADASKANIGLMPYNSALLRKKMINKNAKFVAAFPLANQNDKKKSATDDQLRHKISRFSPTSSKQKISGQSKTQQTTKLATMSVLKTADTPTTKYRVRELVKSATVSDKAVSNPAPAHYSKFNSVHKLGKNADQTANERNNVSGFVAQTATRQTSILPFLAASGHTRSFNPLASTLKSVTMHSNAAPGHASSMNEVRQKNSGLNTLAIKESKPVAMAPANKTAKAKAHAFRASKPSNTKNYPLKINQSVQSCDNTQDRKQDAGNAMSDNVSESDTRIVYNKLVQRYTRSEIVADTAAYQSVSVALLHDDMPTKEDTNFANPRHTLFKHQAQNDLQRPSLESKNSFLELNYKFQHWTGDHFVKIVLPAKDKNTNNRRLLLSPSGLRVGEALNSQFDQLTGYKPKLIDPVWDNDEKQQQQEDNQEEENK